MSAKPIKSDLINQFLSTDGTKTGDHNMAADFSGNPTDFYIEAPAGSVLKIHSVIVLLADTQIISSTKYGGLNVALTNGIDMLFDSAPTGEVSVLAELVKDNAALFGTLGKGAREDFLGNNVDLITIKTNLFPFPAEIDSRENERLIVRVSDDLSGLTEHNFKVVGVLSGPV